MNTLMSIIARMSAFAFVCALIIAGNAVKTPMAAFLLLAAAFMWWCADEYAHDARSKK